MSSELLRRFLTRQRNGAAKCRQNAAARCDVAPLREKPFYKNSTFNAGWISIPLNCETPACP